MGAMPPAEKILILLSFLVGGMCFGVLAYITHLSVKVEREKKAKKFPLSPKSKIATPEDDFHIPF